MSRSLVENKERIARKYFSWESNSGSLKYFDKSITDADHPKGTNVTIKLPFTFIPLDVLGTIKGWHDPSESAIFSNEVKDLAKQPLTVRNFRNGDMFKGLYNDIKDKVAANGGKFGASVYIAYHEDEELVIGNLQLVGAALGSWIEYTKKYPRYKDEGAVTLASFTNEKKGATKFTKPVFEYKKVSEETNTKAVELDKQLQEYLKEYFGNAVHPAEKGLSEENAVNEIRKENGTDKKIEEWMPGDPMSDDENDAGSLPF